MTEEKKEPIIKVTHGSGNDGSRVNETVAFRDQQQQQQPPSSDTDDKIKMGESVNAVIRREVVKENGKKVTERIEV
jgi:hypothetical protein